MIYNRELHHEMTGKSGWHFSSQSCNTYTSQKHYYDYCFAKTGYNPVLFDTKRHGKALFSSSKKPTTKMTIYNYSQSIPGRFYIPSLLPNNSYTLRKHYYEYCFAQTGYNPVLFDTKQHQKAHFQPLRKSHYKNDNI